MNSIIEMCRVASYSRSSEDTIRVKYVFLTRECRNNNQLYT